MLPQDNSRSAASSFGNPFSELPPMTKLIGAGLTVFFALSILFGEVTYNLFLLYPSRTVGSFCLWNFGTAGWFETNIISLLFAVLLLFSCGKVLEPIYGSQEFLKFLIVVNTNAGLVCLLYSLLVHFFFNSPAEGWEELYFGGFGAAMGALLVGLKQQIPDVDIPTICLTLKAKNLSSIWGALYFVFWLIGSRASLFPFLGFYIGWMYLRFFQKKPDSQALGDNRDSFSFSSFFPEALQSPAHIVGNICFKLFEGVLIQTAVVLTSRPANTDLPTTLTFEDSERLKQRGLQSVDHRLEEEKNNNQ